MKELDFNWSADPPTEPGSWWFYGDEDFGSMGGHYTGTVPPRMKLHYVEIEKISNGLIAVTGGHFMSLKPFNAEKRRPGYVGSWRKAKLPSPFDG